MGKGQDLVRFLIASVLSKILDCGKVYEKNLGLTNKHPIPQKHISPIPDSDVKSFYYWNPIVLYTADAGLPNTEASVLISNMKKKLKCISTIKTIKRNHF